MSAGRNKKWISEFDRFKQEEHGCAVKLTPENLWMRLKFSKDKDQNGDVVSDSPSSDWRSTALNNPVEACSDVEEGNIILSPDAYAESKQQHSDRFPSNTKENIADHKAFSDHLRKRKRADDSTCRLCGNNFVKSMCGYMRCHARNLPATDFRSSDQVLPPLNWSMTARRGRKGKAAANPKYEEESEDPLINAANNLLLLSYGGISSGSIPIRQQQNRNSVPYDSRVTNNGDDLKINTQLDSMNMNSTMSREIDKTECSKGNINKLVICYNKTGGTWSCQPAINKPTKKDHLEIATGLALDRKQYSCCICNKSFSSHQALGGHTTIHYKSKRSSKVATIDEAKLAQAESSIAQDGLLMKFSKHRCDICNRTFPTGPALGGHKRKHWLGLEKSAASSSDSARKASHHPCVDVDLMNRPPDLA